jgi:hypothetical protein
MKKKFALAALVLALFSSQLCAQQSSPSRAPPPGGGASSSSGSGSTSISDLLRSPAPGGAAAASSSSDGAAGFWYLYGAFGKGTVGVPWNGGSNAVTGSTGGKIIVGYFPKNSGQANFGEGLSYEGGLVNYGKSTIATSGTYLANNAKVLGKVASAVWNIKEQKWTYRAGAGLAMNTLSDGSSPSIKESNIALRWHLGAAYRIADNIHMVGEYESTSAKSAKNPGINAGTASLSLMSLGVRIDWQ